MESAHRVSGKINFDAKQQINNQQSDCYPLAHITRERQPAEYENATAGVQNVIDIESIARTLLISNSRQCAIQTIAEPIQSEKYDRQNQAGVGIARIPIGQPHADQRKKSERA